MLYKLYLTQNSRAVIKNNLMPVFYTSLSSVIAGKMRKFFFLERDDIYPIWYDSLSGDCVIQRSS
jgi:hypothetical protein